ncbi:unnamed protein product [Mytilus edulis]|uniref:Uncharacterized protein n=1 Tax=Mytilus edulis TaxID=6550 RepID=A0A8S3TZE1_MYTED|nr:unnamed protein product [Mytilus edulis]
MDLSGASTSAASAASTTRPATPMAGDQGPQIQNTPQISDKVTEALKSVRALAGRPNLTPPSVLIAALGFLVECANKASHPEADFFSKALQACRQFENHDDISNLCLKLLGSSEDKKISATIAEWQRNARKNEKTDEKVDSKGCNQMPIQKYIPSAKNPADPGSRKLTLQDSKLTERAWKLVEDRFGPHTVDLMALDSNAMIDSSLFKEIARSPQTAERVFDEVGDTTKLPSAFL